MKMTETLELTKKYGRCLRCDNDKIGGGEGGLIIDDYTFERWCKCGWKVSVNSSESKTNEFTDEAGKTLIVERLKNAIVFKAKEKFEGYSITFEFDEKTFERFRKYLKEISSDTWKNINPKEATSEASNYYEYYDKALDNNGYLTARDYWINFERPVSDSLKLYQINKRKMESLLFDLFK